MADQLSLLLHPPTVQPRIVYFDLETLRDATEVGGWSNIKAMGMAVGVCFDSLDNQYHFYEEKDVQELIEHLRSADLVVGFNHIRFDYTVLTAYSPFNFSTLPSFDILDDITRVLGHRLKLDSLTSSTLGQAKTADGLQSLRWVKEGRMDLVREYCKMDVEVTKNLFLFGEREGHVTFEKSGAPVRVPVSWNVEKIVQAIRNRVNG